MKLVTKSLKKNKNKTLTTNTRRNQLFKGYFIIFSNGLLLLVSLINDQISRMACFDTFAF